MFSTLESTWDRSARRGWSTFASFGFQAMALSLLLLVPLVWVQGPPRLAWLEPPHILVPAGPAPAPPAGPQHHVPTSTNMTDGRVVAPTSFPEHPAILNEQPVAEVPNLDGPGVPGGTCTRGCGTVPNGTGTNVEVIPVPPPPAATGPMKISHYAEGNVVYRVQPLYPPLAKQARIQGTVELRAIISKTGTIENLVAVSGHPMLIPSALSAVRQWRYRPYMLNDEAIPIETEITVNFVLGAN